MTELKDTRRQAPPELAAAYAEIFAGLDRLGPGHEETTARMLALVHPFLPHPARIADMGCGTGADAVDLALTLPEAQVYAVDALPEMARACRDRARRAGIAPRVTVFVGDMCGDFLDRLGMDQLDLIWASSSVWAVGRGTALASWAPLLRPGGWLLFSDLVWLSAPDQRPRDIAAFWKDAYPDMVTPGQVVTEIAQAGLQPISQHLLSAEDWQAYYGPLPERLDRIRARAESPDSALARAASALASEIRIFDSGFGSYTSGFFIARKPLWDW
ncbi:class I SAM-dependent methyltransferase [Marinibaculum pumilum]|uniref:Class I SAM-dependent methyltransferase n=1 Tax=Marinibaculum pumilum TaxID=1766165 RepID=A0ABV7L2J8_9PROT